MFPVSAKLGAHCPRSDLCFSAPFPARETNRQLQAAAFQSSFSVSDSILQMRKCAEILFFSTQIIGLGSLVSNGVASCGFSAGHTCEAYDPCKSNVARPFVRSQVSGSSSAAGERPLPKPARMATVEMLVCFEELVFSAPSSSLQCWAGVQVALGHGVLRWSDLQHSKDLTLTVDALLGITWRMKKRSVQVPWAALRMGVSGRDWAVKWLEVLSYHGLPDKDFVILAPSHGLKSFKGAVANFYHCQSMLRTLLLHSGFTASEAMTFSCHSWRHLFPTAGRQLRLSNETLNDMGHWAPNSGMPQRYDSAACVSELTGKATVRRAFQGGWSMVGP